MTEQLTEDYTGSIFSLIPKIMAEVGAIEKASKNAAQNYKFRGIDDVMAAFQPVLAKYGVFFIPEVISASQTDRESAKGSTLIYTQLTVAYTFYATDGSNIRAVVVGEAMDSADKSSNKAMSAALKYALLQTFCVPVESSDDADAHTPELARKQAATKTTTTSNATMSERDKKLAAIRELLETVAKEEALDQMAAIGVERVSAMTDAQLAQYETGLKLAIENGRIKRTTQDQGGA